MRRCCVVAAALAALLVAGTSSAGRGTALVARQVRAFAMPEGDALSMPTQVAVGPGGEVWVADGVSDRVVGFAADGSPAVTVRQAAGRPLSRPGAVATTADGRLWIADTGNERVVVLRPDEAPRAGGTQRAGGGEEVVLPAALRAGGLDLTDLAVAPDGTGLWLVDNERHRVLRGDLKAGTWVELGGPGEAWGQLRYPFMIAAHPQGGALVTDGLGGRVQGWGEDGRPGRPIGRFGVMPGQLFRPKGIAIDDEGHCWVADGVLGVIQVFGGRGQLLDVLRDGEGEPLRLRHPAGIEVRGDRLWVVELGAARVVEYRVGREDGEPLRASGAWGSGPVGTEGRECTTCHLELVPALAEDRGDGALISPPPSTAQQPWVSTDASCLSCHDGAVSDSRRRVWTMHGHPIGGEPPAGMAVPDDLPLADGKIACRTCHSPHTLGGSGQVHRDAMLLRVADRPSELCVACHGEMAGGRDPR